MASAALAAKGYRLRDRPFASERKAYRIEGEIMGKSVRQTAKKLGRNLGKYAENGGPGRPAGSKNKTGREAMQEILDALVDLNAATDKKGKPLYPGGYLFCMGQEQPRVFAALLGRCLPKDMTLEANIRTPWEDIVKGWNRGPAKPR